MKTPIRYFIISFFLVITQLGFAQLNRKLATQARDFYYQNFGEVKTPENFIQWQDVQNYVVSFKEGGYVLLQKQGANYKVYGLVEKGEFNANNSQNLIGKNTNLNISRIDAASLPPLTVAVRRNMLSDVSNFVTDEWGSVNCIDDQNNIVNVTNYYTPSNCSAGCVGISTSQLLHYWEWPRIGMGNNVYSDNYNGSLVRHGAFFDKAPYDWDDMLDQYMYVASTDVQREAAGRLVYDVTVAVEMNFEPSGSSSNVANVPFILENYFRYTGQYIDRSASNFWSKLYNNIQDRIPVTLAINNSSGEGHAILVSGYKTMNGDPYYYINWGWYNTGSPNNGWYHLRGFNNSTPGYNDILGGLFDAVPEPEITSITPTGTGNDFVVSWEVSNKLNWDEFTLQTKIDNGSWHNVATGITSKQFTYTNPTGHVYLFRVKAKSNGSYYLNSFSEQVAYTPQGSYNGYGSFEGSQYAYAKQTPGYDLIFNHDYTFETWIRLKPGNQNADVIFDRQYIFAFEIEDLTSSDYSVVFKSPAAQDALHSNSSGQKLQIGQWYHIAVSNQGQTARLFVNGTERDMDNNNHFHLNSSNASINIGERYHGSYSGYIKADFDQIRFSDVARYTADFTPVQNTDFVVDANTRGYFKFQNVHRNRLKDEAHRVSVRVKNAPNYVHWEFDYDPTTGIEEIDLFDANISVFPNPTTDFITINSKDDRIDLADYKLELYDMSGKNMGIQPIKEADAYRINLESFSAGRYILKLSNDKIKAGTIIIKQ